MDQSSWAQECDDLTQQVDSQEAASSTLQLAEASYTPRIVLRLLWSCELFCELLNVY